METWFWAGAVLFGVWSWVGEPAPHGAAGAARSAECSTARGRARFAGVKHDDPAGIAADGAASLENPPSRYSPTE